MPLSHLKPHERFEHLKQRYIEKLESLCAVFSNILSEATEADELTTEQKDELRHYAHRLGGTGTTYGFSNISAAGQKLEAALEQSPAPSHYDILSHLATLVQACDQALSEDNDHHFAHSAHEETPHAPDAQKHILIADDDEDVCDLLAVKFATYGCKVTCSLDGKTAWEKLQEQHYDLLVLDCIMPGFDGMSLLAMMNEDEKLIDIPVVFLTSQQYGSSILEGISAGAAEYITKPFDPEDVVKKCLLLMDPLT